MNIFNQERKGEKNLFKIVVSGEGRVGKTSLLRRYVDNEFDDDYLMTLGTNFFVKRDIKIGKKEFLLQIWDFGGQERFKSLLEEYIKGTNGALFCFDLKRKETLESIEKWIQLLRKLNKHLPIILVGTKLDLIDSEDKSFYLFVEKIRLKYNLFYYIKTSAKEDIHIDLTFEYLINEIERIRFIKNLIINNCIRQIENKTKLGSDPYEKFLEIIKEYNNYLKNKAEKEYFLDEIRNYFKFDKHIILFPFCKSIPLSNAINLED